MSHELRTPLSAMKLMLETVLAADDDAEARTLFLPQIGDEVERMIRLVEDLLELARSESGTIPMRRERFDLGDVAAATVNTFAQRAGALGIELDLEAPDAVDVDADRGRLTQVAVNLVDNALRHTPSGGSVIVEVARAGTRRDPARARHRRRHPVRRPAARVRAVLRRRPLAFARSGGGTGLGLAIAKHLVEAHGGSLVAESRVRPRRDVHDARPGRAAEP